jgi:hypothetical protein
MKRIVFALIGASAIAFGQAQPPQLSTADKVAIQTLEKTKQDARKQFEGAQQSELTVLSEWGASHPGYHVNQQTFAVEQDPKPTKPEAPKEPKKP